MGHTYSSSKPINRLYREYMNPLLYDTDSIADPEWIKELQVNMTKALNQISDNYIETHLGTQLDMPPKNSNLPVRNRLDIRHRLCVFYIKKVMMAISARTYSRQIARIDPANPDVKRYRTIFSKLVKKVHSARRGRRGQIIQSTHYMDMYIRESELERMYVVDFEPRIQFAKFDTESLNK